MLSYSISQNDETGTANIALYLAGDVLQARSDHPSYQAILEGLLANDETVDYPALFSAERAIASKFSVLSDRVSVKNGEVYLDGDQVDGALERQIVSFLEAGEDFTPLVLFYEKLLSNPLGNVQQGIYDWAVANGLTISDDGNLLGYKSLQSTEDGYKPSRASATGQDRVNGQEVGQGNEIVQNPGDVVEMPRSKVLNEPSRACADGLHIGTFSYAHSFYGDTVMLVEFNPRDIVSLPDSNSSWKLRVCRYTVLMPVSEALAAPVFHTVVEPDEDDSKGEWDGARGEDWDGDLGTISGPDEDGKLLFTYDAEGFYPVTVGADEVTTDPDVFEQHGDEGFLILLSEDEDNTAAARQERRKLHGKGGRHSKAAEGNGLNPAQDPISGQFTQGRPGSQRNTAGQFSA